MLVSIAGLGLLHALIGWSCLSMQPCNCILCLSYINKTRPVLCSGSLVLLVSGIGVHKVPHLQHLFKVGMTHVIAHVQFHHKHDPTITLGVSACTAQLWANITAKIRMQLQIGFWDGSVAVVRLEPSKGPPPSGPVPSLGQDAATASGRAVQRDMVVLTHFQVDPTPLRAVAWIPPQVQMFVPFLCFQSPADVTLCPPTLSSFGPAQ